MPIGQSASVLQRAEQPSAPPSKWMHASYVPLHEAVSEHVLAGALSMQVPLAGWH